MDKDKSSVKYVRSGPLAQAGFTGVQWDSMVLKTGLKCETSHSKLIQTSWQSVAVNNPTRRNSPKSPPK